MLRFTFLLGKALPRGHVRLRVQYHTFGHWADHWSVLGKSIFYRSWRCVCWFIDHECVSRIKRIARRLRLHFSSKIARLIDYNWLWIQDWILLLMRLTIRLLMERSLPNNLGLLYWRSHKRTIDPEGALQVRMCHIGELGQLLVVHLLRTIFNYLDLVRV